MRSQAGPGRRKGQWKNRWDGRNETWVADLRENLSNYCMAVEIEQTEPEHNTESKEICVWLIISLWKLCFLDINLILLESLFDPFLNGATLVCNVHTLGE